jgi:hypothetical protein
MNLSNEQGRAMMKSLIDCGKNDPFGLIMANESFEQSIKDAQIWCERVGVNPKDKFEVTLLITLMVQRGEDDILYAALGCGYILGQESMKDKS